MEIKMLMVLLLVNKAFGKDEPRFIGMVSNVTVVEGRDAALVCRVQDLGNYKVAWLRVDTQTILTIGPHVITKNHRVAVTRGDPQAWTLTLRDVQPADGGRYMCQINTEPMITQTHQLQVVVPPDIVDSDSSSEVRTREGDSVTLHCAASGTPQPNVTWRREDGAAFPVNSRSVSKWSGAWLNLTAVTRRQSGAYLCIAANGVPPTVSKRILLHVLCEPSAWAIQKLLGAYAGNSALLQCKIEAFPLPTVHWYHINNQRLNDDWKYQASMKSEGYRHTASLQISNVSREDIGPYRCRVENALGQSEDDITLYTLATTTTVAPTTPTSTTLLDLLSSSTGSDIPIDLHPLEDDHYVVVLSQHQMQNPDMSPSS